MSICDFAPALPSAAQEHGLKYAERFHYIGPDKSLDEYIATHAVPIG